MTIVSVDSVRSLERLKILYREQLATAELDERDLSPSYPPTDQMRADSESLRSFSY